MESHSLEIRQMVDDWATHMKRSEYLDLVERDMLRKLMYSVYTQFEFPFTVTVKRNERLLPLPVKGECGVSPLTEITFHAIVVGQRKESGTNE